MNNYVLLENDTILTVKEAAQILRTSQATMYRLVGKGEIPHFRVNGSIKFRLGTLTSWINQQESVV
jgi:DNA binding domain, excisionase family